MENKPINVNPQYIQLTVIISLTLVASMLPEVIFRELVVSVPAGVSLVRLIVLFVASVLSKYLRHNNIAKYSFVLGVIVFAETLTRLLFSSYIWQKTFDMNSFVGNFGGAILLKVIGVIPIVWVLVVLFKAPKVVFIVNGNLSIKADEIKWLGIKEDTISWAKLAMISALLISLGTILLTVLTVTGSSTNFNFDNLMRYFPFVVVFAVLNSLCEGIVFRSAILGSLKNVLPKNQVIFISAFLFGIGHYYGAPSGIVGVAMSTILGWYLARSMYETNGFTSSWIIHFMQDVVIFSIILLLGSYY